MIRANSIRLERAEGRPHECVAVTIERRHDADPFHAAEQILSAWAQTAPDTGGYDKCDFEVEYEDGQKYEGRYDLVRGDVGRLDMLGEHIRSFVEFVAGTRRPDHLSEEQYGSWMKRHEGDSAAARAWLQKDYQMGVACQHEFAEIKGLDPTAEDYQGKLDGLAAQPPRCQICEMRQPTDGYKQARGASVPPEGAPSAEDAIRHGRGA